MMLSFHRILLMVVALGVAACGAEAPAPAESQPLADATAAQRAAADAGTQPGERAPTPGPALWQLSDDDTTVYLFGTFHALKPDIVWFEGPIKAAYEASDEVALEATDLQDVQRMGQLVLQYAIDPQGRKLSSVIGEELAQKLAARLSSINLSLQQIEPMEPWMATMTLAMQQVVASGYDPALGVDMALQNAASADGKTLTGIEGAEAQLKLLDSIEEDSQIEWLELSLRDWDEAPESLNDLLSYWADGRVEEFGEEMVESMDDVPNLADLLLTQRNATFAEWVVERMDEPGTVFVAVGAGHLAGPDSVQDFLKAKGYTVTRQ